MGGQVSGFKLRRRDDTVPGKPAKYGVVFFAEQEEPVRGKLQVTADDIILFQKSKEARIWPIRSIRRCRFFSDILTFSYWSNELRSLWLLDWLIGWWVVRLISLIRVHQNLVSTFFNHFKVWLRRGAIRNWKRSAMPRVRRFFKLESPKKRKSH